MQNFITFFILLLFFSMTLFSQDKGAPSEFPKDSTIIFESPRPLVKSEIKKSLPKGGWGANIHFNESGFGFGMILNFNLSNSLILQSDFSISNARNTDEFDSYYYYGYVYYYQVKDKINRLYKMPINIGLQYLPFKDDMSPSFQPFFTLGGGFSMILANPYTFDRIPNGQMVGWFESFKYGDFYIRPSGFIGVGAYFADISQRIYSASFKYHYIPFGGNGLESIINYPITNFGVFSLNLTIGGIF